MYSKTGLSTYPVPFVVHRNPHDPWNTNSGTNCEQRKKAEKLTWKVGCLSSPGNFLLVVSDNTKKLHWTTARSYSEKHLNIFMCPLIPIKSWYMGFPQHCEKIALWQFIQTVYKGWIILMFLCDRFWNLLKMSQLNPSFDAKFILGRSCIFSKAKHLLVLHQNVSSFLFCMLSSVRILFMWYTMISLDRNVFHLLDL